MKEVKIVIGGLINITPGEETLIQIETCRNINIQADGKALSKVLIENLSNGTVVELSDQLNLWRKGQA